MKATAGKRSGKLVQSSQTLPTEQGDVAVRTHRKPAALPSSLAVVVCVLAEVLLTPGCGKVLGSEAADELFRRFQQRRFQQRVPQGLEKLAASLRDDTAGQTVESLIQALKDENLLVRSRAAKALGTRGDRRAVSPLMEALVAASGESPDIDVHLEALKSDDWAKRSNAAGALGRSGNTRAVEPLIAALKDRNPFVKSNAVRALGNIGDPRAVQSLIEALNDSDRNVRLVIVGALAQFRDGQAEAGLRKAQKDSDWLVRSQADFALSQRQNKNAPLPLTGDSQFRASAVEALGRLGDRRAVKFLTELLQDRAPRVRIAAAEALGRIGDTSAAAALVDATKDDEGRMRITAAEALPALDADLAIQPLIDLLNSDDPKARIRAADALGKMRDARAAEPLVSALERAMRNDAGNVSASLANAVVLIGEPAIAPLLASLNRANAPDWRVYKTETYRSESGSGVSQVFTNDALGFSSFQTELLVRFGEPAVQPLIEELNDDNSHIRSIAADVLGDLGDARAVEPLAQALREGAAAFPSSVAESKHTLSRDGLAPATTEFRPLISRLSKVQAGEDLRRAAKQALTWIGRPAVESLITLLQDESNAVRTDAAEVLGLIGDKRAAGPLLEMLAVLPKFAVYDEYHLSLMVEAGISALTRIDPRGVELLTPALKHRSFLVRSEAARALGEVGEKRAVPALIAAMKDPDPGEQLTSVQRYKYWYTCKAAAWALGEIGDKGAVPALIAAMKHPDQRTQFSAIRALGRIGDRGAVAPLIDALPDAPHVTDSTLPIAAALADLRDPRAVQPLIDVLRRIEHAGFGEGTIVRALGGLGDPRAVRPLIETLNKAYVRGGEMNDVFEALADLNHTSAVEPLIDFMLKERPVPLPIREGARRSANRGDESGAKRLLDAQASRTIGRYSQAGRAGRTLVSLGDKRAVRAFFEAHVKGTLATEVVAELLVAMGDAAATRKALADTGHERLVEQLIDMLEEDAPYGSETATYKQARAAEALGLLGDKRAIEPLIRHAHKNNKAIEAPGRFGDHRAVDVLIGLLPRDAVAAVGLLPRDAVAMEALAKLGDRRAIPPLVAALRQKGVAERSAAVRALEKLGWHPQNQEEEALYHIAKQQWDECVRIGSPAVDLLVSFDWSDRHRVFTFNVGDNDKGSTVPFVEQDEDVSKGAIRALGQIGDKRATDRLLRVLESNQDSEIRRTAIEAVRKLADKRAVPALVPLLRHWHISALAAAALRDLGWKPQSLRDRVYLHVANEDKGWLAAEWPAAREVLLSDLRDSDLEYGIRKNAAYALIAMGREETVRPLALEMTRLAPSASSEQKELLETLLNSGHQVLAHAGRVCALRRRYAIKSGKGRAVVTWGGMIGLSPAPMGSSNSERRLRLEADRTQLPDQSRIAEETKE